MNEERFYETLGLRPGATRDELKTAYRDMAKVWHPDRFAHDPRLQQMAQEKLKEINEAYKQLTSPRPPFITFRGTRAGRYFAPAVAAVVVIAAVTFFAATRVFTNKTGATAAAA